VLEIRRNNLQQKIISSPPLGLYIHLPWCIKKCPYCDFNSHEVKGSIPILSQEQRTVQIVAQVATPTAVSTVSDELQEQYIAALQADLEQSVALVWGRVVHSIFIGGGTPSLFSEKSIDRILTIVRTHLRVSADAEITMEANPGTFEKERFEGFARAGVNRLSIGVQSFNNAQLKKLGRVHDAAQALAAIEVAAKRYPTFNIDLMYGLPEQSFEELELDFETANRLSPPHLSYYQLTLEPNTLFAAKPPTLPDDDTLAAMQALIESSTAHAGYEHYEISAYAKVGHRSKHNLNYWQFGDYLGLGAGAHGKLTFHDGIRRYAKFKQPAAYMQKCLAGNANEIEQLIAPEDLPFEFMLNALRLSDGVDTESFTERTGLSLAVLNQAMAKACKKGLLDEHPARIKATPHGLLFLNDLQELFLPETKK
jgi:putative oxygen-independent coproporphyrinogen III oxidase